jgi:hypothetical protein
MGKGEKKVKKEKKEVKKEKKEIKKPEVKKEKKVKVEKKAEEKPREDVGPALMFSGGINQAQQGMCGVKRLFAWYLLLLRLCGRTKLLIDYIDNILFSASPNIRRPLSAYETSACHDCAWLSLTALSTVTCNLWL